jgi:hypothetical protein
LTAEAEPSGGTFRSSSAAEKDNAIVLTPVHPRREHGWALKEKRKMARVQESQSLKASVDEVWAVVGGFDALPDWHPAVKGSTLEQGGRVRRLQLGDGNALIERLQAFSESERSYAYSIEQGPLPVARYRSLVRVSEEPGRIGCRVDWSGEFSPAGVSESEAVDIIAGIYRAGLDQLGQRFGR